MLLETDIGDSVMRLMTLLLILVMREIVSVFVPCRVLMTNRLARVARGVLRNVVVANVRTVVVLDGVLGWTRNPTAGTPLLSMPEPSCG